MDMGQFISLVTFIVLIIGGFAIIGTIDYWIYYKFTVKYTFSRAMQRMGYINPLFPALFGLIIGLAIGVLLGHFWWPQPPI